MATITKGTNRFGQTYWAVRWGKGATQLVICSTRAEAERVAVQGHQGLDRVEPLVSFRYGENSVYQNDSGEYIASCLVGTEWVSTLWETREEAINVVRLSNRQF